MSIIHQKQTNENLTIIRPQEVQTIEQLDIHHNKHI